MGSISINLVIQGNRMRSPRECVSIKNGFKKKSPVFKRLKPGGSQVIAQLGVCSETLPQNRKTLSQEKKKGGGSKLMMYSQYLEVLIPHLLR
jgi:hypothetical protein